MSETTWRVTKSDDEIYHHGIIGMKWGVRRYQKKDGSLTNLGKKHYDKETEKLKAEKRVLKNQARTQKKIDKVNALKKEVDDLKKANEEAQSGESREEKRQRLLKSTNVKELYKNKDLLTTDELNERISRIDVEQRLNDRTLNKINGKLDKVSTIVKNVSAVYSNVDSAYSTLTKSSIGKEVLKQLGITKPKRQFDLDSFVKNIDYMTDEQVKAKSERLNNMENIRQKKNRLDNIAKENAAKDNAAKNLKKAQKQVNSYNKNWYSNDSGRNSSYSMKGDHIVDRKVGTGNRNFRSTPLLSEPIEKVTGTVEGSGTSKYYGFANSYVDDNPVWRDVTTGSSDYSSLARIGQGYIAGYLPYDSKKK